MKIVTLFFLFIFSSETFAYLCPLDPKLSKEEQEEVCRKGGENYVRSLERIEQRNGQKKDCFINGEESLESCYPNPAGPSEIQELRALGKKYAGTSKIPPRVDEICKGHVRCKAIYLWERNNKEGPGVPNPMTEMRTLTKIETDMRLQQKCNCANDQTFTACGFYKQYLNEVIPHSRLVICAAIGCEKQYEVEKKKREEYLRLRVPENIFTVAAKFPKAFIDPMVASDEYRAYAHVISLNPGLEETAREEFKGRLCAREKQTSLGSDHDHCELFVDALIEQR